MASFINEIVTIRCRICKKEILRKNYKSHLTRLHPEENSDDTTPFGQKTISDLFSNLKKKVKATTTDIEHLENSEEISEKVRETSKRRIEINVSEGERLKKRYESGDSGSGIGVSSKKRHESGDSEVVNISKVNDQ